VKPIERDLDKIARKSKIIVAICAQMTFRKKRQKTGESYIITARRGGRARNLRPTKSRRSGESKRRETKEEESRQGHHRSKVSQLKRGRRKTNHPIGRFNKESIKKPQQKDAFRQMGPPMPIDKGSGRRKRMSGKRRP